MLENLTPDVCVSRSQSAEQELWICYEPLTIQAHSKRVTWKRLTGPLSTPDMKMFLRERYQSKVISTEFESLSERSGPPEI